MSYGTSRSSGCEYKTIGINGRIRENVKSAPLSFTRSYVIIRNIQREMGGLPGLYASASAKGFLFIFFLSE